MNNSSLQGKHFWRIASVMLLFVQIVSSSFFITPVFAAAAPESIISYQGRLLNNNRVPVSSTSASILFELYTAVSGGSCVWSNSSSTCASATARTVTLTDGLFSENLGDTTDADPYAAIGDAVFGNNATLYLQVTVNGETLTPRKHIAAAPYALNAHLLDGLAADSDGSTSPALVALNSSGSLVVTGNPSGSGVANGALYINPASGDVAVDDTLFGVAVDGTERFRVDGEGDTSIGGSLLLAGSALSSSSSTVNIFDDSLGTTRIDVGGVDTDRGNTINIATNSTTADAVVIGNVNAATLLTLTGGTAWSISSLGSATFSDVTCTDCLDWTEFSDALTLDASTSIGFGASTNSLTFTNDGSGNIITNLTSTGDAMWGDSGSPFLTLTDTGAFSYVLDAVDNPNFVVTNAGTGNITFNLSGSAGSLRITDNGVATFNIDATGAYTYTLDNEDNPGYTITNQGTGDIVTHLNGTGDINFTDNGVPFFTLNDSGGFNVTLDATDNPAFIVTNQGSTDMQVNLNGTGDYLFVDNGVTFLTLTDTGAFSYTLDAVDNPNFNVTNSGTGNIGFNLAGSAGNFRVSDNAVTALQIDATGAYSFTLDSTDNPTYVINNNGSSNIATNLLGSGDVTFSDNSSPFLTLDDTGGYAFTLDAADNPTYTITDSGSSNVITNLAGTGDFVIQDNGIAFATFSDSGIITLEDSVVVGSSSRIGNFLDSTTVTGTWSGGLGDRNVSSMRVGGDYQANEATGTDGYYTGLDVYTQVSAGGDLHTLYGGLINAANTSADASAIEADIYGVYAYGSNLAAVTVPAVYGIYGSVNASSGTITTGYGVYGNIASDAGDMTTAYGGYFQNTSEGTTRYGVVGRASGGTNNYAGYFIDALTELDDNTDPTDSIPNNAPVSGAGDLFVRDSLEGDGSLYYGDSTGSDEFIFTSAATSGSVFTVNATAVDTNTGFEIVRASSVATDFDGILFDVEQNRTSAGSDGIVFNLKNMSGGNSPALYITQDQVADATVTPNAQALVIDVNESANSDEVILIRSDADNSSGLRDTEFRFENDGDAFADGAWTGAGADYAEFFPSADRTLGDFELACWNASQASGVKRCDAGETNIVGVISTNPGFIGNSYSGAETSLENNPNYALVGLVGQIETYVSADAGAIAIGDALTTSSARAGYAAKASGGTYIIGRALEPLASGTGTIKVLVQPMWYGGDMLTMNGSATTFAQDITLQGAGATAADTTVDSAGLSFVGSLWNGSAAHAVSLTLRNSVLGDGSAQLGLQNDDGIDVMTFGSTGDLALAGNLYPSDRGALQYGAYVYYDSTAAGYMKTNAAGWSSESSSFAESFTSADLLEPGDVVEFAPDGSGVVRSSGTSYSNRIAGVVSSRSAFLAGDTVGAYPIAVSGRVSMKVNDENGVITSGDALTTSSHPGVAMKATSSGQIIGYALESLASGEGSILAFVRPQYVAFGGSGVSSLAIDAQDVETLNVTGLLSMNGGDIVNVGTLSGIGTWEIQENGDIITHGQLTQVVKSLQNTDVSTYPTTSTETLVQLSGTTTLHGGIARVSFDDVDENFNDIISPEASYRVLVTPDGITGQLYVTDRSNAGFIIHDVNQGEGVSVDWLVLAYRHDLVPSAQHLSPAEESVQEQIPLEEEQGTPLDEGSGGDTVESGAVDTQLSGDPAPVVDPDPSLNVPSGDVVPDAVPDAVPDPVPDPVLDVVPEASPENAP